VKKIVIIGCPASGKTTLSNKLGRQLNIPVYHLDKIFWAESGGIKQEKFLEAQEEILKKEAWVVDGNFHRSKTFPIRLEQADTIILLNLPKWRILWQLLKRTIKNYGGNRPDMPSHHRDKFDWKLIKFIWNFPSEELREKVALYQNQKKVYVIKKSDEQRAILDSLTF
jgi:adenylate kinase family enzyme